MIYDKITNLGQYAFENPRMMSCIQDIRTNLLGETHGTADFRKNSISFTTTPISEKRYEAHNRFIDIHIVLEGREYVEVSNVECLTSRSEYDRERDIYFGDVGTGPRLSGYLEPGYFLICFPEDTHLVGAHEEREQEVTKIIYKIGV
ncbi:YhcH/YjgK/YiaL family protein [Paenibacillus sp. FJAT-26967]|uniref:YhcH/YjgK/YiaL family protein n=1 Tax=Paenibacillus sp. FJAT-26967 TaxID=1729690 RepID=UPI000838D619|nr:YhcH/YjgK/YiaL family protein [Paenibacillus sp. FJAT-26967]